MRERPLILSAPMVLAVMAGRKTVTRRVMKPQPEWHVPRSDAVDPLASCPYGSRGERLWIKERWRPFEENGGAVVVVRYAADGAVRRFPRNEVPPAWKPPQASARGDVTPLFMPRWASRLTLERTATGIDRPRDLDVDDIRAEGMIADTGGDEETALRDAWRMQWVSVNGTASWDANPWVWAVGFRVVD